MAACFEKKIYFPKTEVAPLTEANYFSQVAADPLEVLLWTGGFEFSTEIADLSLGVLEEASGFSRAAMVLVL